MDKYLQERIDSFINDFLSLKEVKQYLLLKEEINSSLEIKSLVEKLNASKKDLALSLGTTSYEDRNKEYHLLQEQYDFHPLIMNFNVVKEEVGFLLDEIQRKLK